MRHLRSIAALTGVLATGPALATDCHVDPFQLFFGSDVETHMTVRSGTTCGVSFLQGGPGRTISAGGINRLLISQAPQHGRASTSGFDSWGYASQKGYVGHDRFVVESAGELMYRRIIRGTSNITVEVDVVR